MSHKSQVVKEIKSDIKTAKKIWLPWWGVLCIMVVTIPLVLLFDRFGKVGIALPALDSTAILTLAIVIKWNLRRNVWFWITMAIVVVLHVLLILSVPWTDKWVPASTIAGIGVVDLVVILVVVSIVENFMRGEKTAER